MTAIQHCNSTATSFSQGELASFDRQDISAFLDMVINTIEDGQYGCATLALAVFKTEVERVSSI